MAMYQPRSRIVGAKGDDNITIGRQQNDISAGRIVELGVESIGKGGAADLLYDGEVVAMQVHLRCVRQ